MFQALLMKRYTTTLEFFSPFLSNLVQWDDNHNISEDNSSIISNIFKEPSNFNDICRDR